ncbi:ABC transporter permease [Oscillibacter sp. MSJ-2]|uniref:Nickel import system permease protein NikB n=1 Tax=Dysosmobacter acutus TaxID=2841504 RepID=A0ABS6F869_9FIRM|nr:nickel ABC transporter permease [Dysosmobacter acutus]MBU5626489.1 ABC transporter permease [Dysosmobacter acutus]
MVRYIVKRFIALIPVLLGVTLIIFTLLYFTPGDPALIMLGDEAATPEAIAQVHEELGLDDPFWVRYGNYVLDLLHGDLGVSYLNKRPVADMLLERLPKTMTLACVSAALAIVLGITLGVIAAVKHNSIFDNLCMVFALGGVSMPHFWQGLLLMLLFGVKLGWLPISGYGTFAQLVLPALTIGYGCMAIIARMTRSSMLEVINQDYINFAHAKGQKKLIIITRHALQNALIPIITTIALQFGILLGGSVITESIFAIPGIGKLMVDSIRASNYPVVQGGVLMIAFIYCVNNLLVDIIYAFIDPRMKTSLSNAR